MTPDDAELSSLIRDHGTRHAAPDDLVARVQANAALADAGRPVAPPPWAWLGRLGARMRRALAVPGLSVGFALGVVCTVAAWQLAGHLRSATDLESVLVGNHVRALQVGPIAQVQSSDRHTVKPWFQGRLSYAPAVFDLADDGFPMIGGRVDHVDGRAVAALAYRRHLHVVDLTVWPCTDPRSLQVSVRDGFTVARWCDGAMQVWLVSDLERREVERLAAAWQARVRSQ